MNLFISAGWLLQFIYGLGIGVSTLGLAYCLLFWMLTWSPSVNKAWDTLLLVCGGIITAIEEEIIFRGAIFALLALINVPVAVILSSVIFAICHFWLGMYKGQDYFSPKGLGLTLLGAILALTCILTGSIYMGIGIHAGWIMVVSVCPFLLGARVKPEYEKWIAESHPVVGTYAGIITALITTYILRKELRKENG